MSFWALSSAVAAAFKTAGEDDGLFRSASAFASSALAAAFSSDAAKSEASALDYGVAPERAYGSYKEMVEKEKQLPKDERIDFGSPTIDAAGHRAHARYTLLAEPRSGIQAAHSMMAEEDDFARPYQALQVCGNLAQRNQNRTFDARGFMLPFLTHVHQQKFLAPLEPLAHFVRRHFNIREQVLGHGCFRSHFSNEWIEP